MRIDLKKLLQEVREEQAIEKIISKVKAPLPSQSLKVGSDRWGRRVREEERLEKNLDIAEQNKVIRRSLAQARYYEKNKRKLNYHRTVRARQPLATFKRAKRRAELRGQEWTMTFDEWRKVWSDAPDVMHPVKKYKVPAWEMRGGNYKTHTQMVRIDPEGPWSVENVRIQLPVFP